MSGIPVQAEMFEAGQGGILRVAAMPTTAPDAEKPATRDLNRFNEPRNTHRNSRAAYQGARTMRHDRSAIVLGLFQDNPHATFTYRQALDRLYPCSGGLNMVRPRITELVEAGELREIGSVRCSVTGKTVRACAVNTALPDRSQST